MVLILLLLLAGGLGLTGRLIWENAPTVTVSRADLVPRPVETIPPDAERITAMDLNEATADQLLALPLIGETVAKRVVAYREENGDFERIEDIMLVKGIGEGIFAKIKDFIYIGGTDIEDTGS